MYDLFPVLSIIDKLFTGFQTVAVIQLVVVFFISVPLLISAILLRLDTRTVEDSVVNSHNIMFLLGCLVVPSVILGAAVVLGDFILMPMLFEALWKS